MNNVVKSHFQKYGLPKQTLESLESLILNSVEDKEDENKVKEACGKFDGLAKSYQKDWLNKLNEVKNTSEDEDQGDSDEISTEPKKKDSNNNNEMKELLQKLYSKVEKLESDKIATSLNAKVSDRLKDLKLTDAEVNAVMYGRKFMNDEQVEDFLSKQEEYFADIVKDRVSESTASGQEMPGGGETGGSASIDAIVKNYKESNELKN